MLSSSQSTALGPRQRTGFRDLMQRLHGAGRSVPVEHAANAGDARSLLTPDIAIMHSRFWIAGEVMHDEHSHPDRESVGTRVLHKIDGRWRIVATQNTDARGMAAGISSERNAYRGKRGT